MRSLYLLSVFFHILAAVVWIGGMVFLATVLVPAVRRPEHQRVAASLVQLTGTRFRVVGWACLGVLLLTGALNLASWGITWADVLSGRVLHGPFGRLLGIKSVLVTAVFLLSAVHDFRIGPRATAVWQASPDSPETARLRRVASWLGRFTLLLGLAAVAVGVMLVRGWP
jgi:putative copper resistance protein D